MSDSLTAVESTEETATPGTTASGSLWQDAWASLRKNPLFWFSAFVVLMVCTWAAFPGLWTTIDKDACDLSHNREGPGNGHIFGTTVQGCDMYTYIIYGARPSIIIGTIVTVCTALIGGTLGVLSGFYGGWTDTIISRITDIFLGIPFLLGALSFLALLPDRNIWTVTFVLVVLGWTSFTRIVRGQVISLRDQEFIEAARALGASNARIIRRHIIPNSLSPIIVLSTLYVGINISAEATLTFLGVGLEQGKAISWGVTVAEGEGFAVTGDAYLLLFPCAALILTVLSFVLLGDLLRDALDPRGR